MNTLFYGDNLAIMKHMPLHSVDLIYLDPPFNSNKNYNLMYTRITGQPVPESVDAFCDTWEMDAEKEAVLRAMPVLMQEKGVDDFYVQFWRMWMTALRQTQPKLLAYLTYMVQRLLYMKGLLRPTGSIYLHCDPAASHYIKIMMDAIFGHNNYRSEIIWRRSASHNKLSKQYGPIHDVIFFYAAGEKAVFHPGRSAYNKAYVGKAFRYSDGRGPYRLNELTGSGIRKGESGEPWRGYDPTAKGRHWAIPASLRAGLPDRGKGMAPHQMLDALDKSGDVVFSSTGRPSYKQRMGDGVPYQDIWAYQPGTQGVLVDEEIEIDQDVKWLDSEDERLGYPTQKPIGLLKRIIETSSNPGQVVFDPFCGCGTTIYAAHELHRQWIGCDIAMLPINLIRDQLTSEKYRLVEDSDFKIDGIPASVEQAQRLWTDQPFTFQTWLVERVGGFPPARKSGDRGVDGRLYFDTEDGLREAVLSVKGGHVRPTDVRDLRGVLERESTAVMAGFLSLQEPSRAMREEAGAAGVYTYKGVQYPRIQFLTVREILEERRWLHTPTRVGTRMYTGQESLAL